jgi:hypothetical protein
MRLAAATADRQKVFSGRRCSLCGNLKRKLFHALSNNWNHDSLGYFRCPFIDAPHVTQLKPKVQLKRRVYGMRRCFPDFLRTAKTLLDLSQRDALYPRISLPLQS